MTTEHLRYAQELLAENTRLRQEHQRLTEKMEERLQRVHDLLQDNIRLREELAQRIRDRNA